MKAGSAATRIEPMGWVKRQQSEYEERGFGSASWSICLDHITDADLQKRLANEATNIFCTFCTKSSSTEMFAVDGRAFMSQFMEAFRYFYQDAANELSWDAESGHYLGDVVGTDEAVASLAAPDLVDEEVFGEVFRTVCQTIGFDTEWTECGTESERDDLIYPWEEFQELVKHRARFFLLHPTMNNGSHELAEFLDAFGSCLEDSLNLVQTIEPGAFFYRGRLFDELEESHITIDSLGPAPQSRAASNRMSPAGVPIMYVTEDIQTAEMEIGAHGEKQYMIIGEFINLNRLRVLDLTQEPDWPSIFDPTALRERRMARFFNRFREDISRSIAPDDQDIEYVPTQVITEYLRWISSPRIDGLKFPSAHTGRPTYALFFNREDFELEPSSRSGSDELSPTKCPFSFDPSQVRYFKRISTYKPFEP